MEIFEIISAIVLIVACVFIIIIVLMKDTKTQMSQAIGGASSDNFFQKNSGRTKEAKLNKATVIATVVFFVLALLVNFINVHAGKDADASGADSSSVTESTGSEASDADEIIVTGEAEGDSSAAEDTASDAGTDSAMESSSTPAVDSEVSE